MYSQHTYTIILEYKYTIKMGLCYSYNTIISIQQNIILCLFSTTAGLKHIKDLKVGFYFSKINHILKIPMEQSAYV